MDNYLGAYLVLILFIQIQVLVHAQWQKFGNSYYPIRQPYMQLNPYAPNNPWAKSSIIQRPPYFINGLQAWKNSLASSPLRPLARAKTNILQPPKVQPIRKTPFLPRKDLSPRGRFIQPNVFMQTHPVKVVNQNAIAKFNGRFNVPNKISITPRVKPIIPKTRITSLKKPYLINANQIQNPVAKLLYTSRDPKVRVNILSKLSTPDYSKIVEKIKKKFTVDLPYQLNKIPHFNTANDRKKTTTEARKSSFYIPNNMKDARKPPSILRRNHIVNATTTDGPHWFDLYNRLKALKDLKARNKIANKAVSKQVTGSSRSVISNAPIATKSVPKKNVLGTQKKSSFATDIPHFLTNPYEEEVSIFAHEQVSKNMKKSAKHDITHVVNVPNRYDTKNRLKPATVKTPINLLNEYKKSIKENAHQVKQQESVSQVKNSIARASNTVKHNLVTSGREAVKKEKKLDDYMKDFFKQTFKKVVSPEITPLDQPNYNHLDDGGKSKSLIPVSPLFHSIINHNRQNIIKTKSSINENHVAESKNIAMFGENKTETISNKNLSEGNHKSSNLHSPTSETEHSSSLVNGKYNNEFHHIVLDTFNKTFRSNLGKYDDYDDNDFDLMQKEKTEIAHNISASDHNSDQMSNTTNEVKFINHEIGYRNLTSDLKNVSDDSSQKDASLIANNITISNEKSATNLTDTSNSTSITAENDKSILNSKKNNSISNSTQVSLKLDDKDSSGLNNGSVGSDVGNKTSLLDASSTMNNKSSEISAKEATLLSEMFTASIMNSTITSKSHGNMVDKKNNTNGILNGTSPSYNKKENGTVVEKSENITKNSTKKSDLITSNIHLSNKTDLENSTIFNNQNASNILSQNSSTSNEEHNEDSASQNSESDLKSLKHAVYSPSILGFDEELSDVNEQDSLLEPQADKNSMVDQRSKIKKQPTAERFTATAIADKRQDLPFDLKSKSHVPPKTNGGSKNLLSLESNKAPRAVQHSSKIKESSMENLTDVNKMLAFIDEVNLLATPPVIIKSDNHKTLKKSNVTSTNGNARSVILTHKRLAKNHKQKNKKEIKKSMAKKMTNEAHKFSKKQAPKKHTNLVQRVTTNALNKSANVKNVSASIQKVDRKKSYSKNSTQHISSHAVPIKSKVKNHNGNITNGMPDAKNWKDKSRTGNYTKRINVSLSDKTIFNTINKSGSCAHTRKHSIPLGSKHKTDKVALDNTKRNAVRKNDLRTIKKVRKSVVGDTVFSLGDTENNISDDPMQEELPKTNQEELEALKEEQQANAMMKMPETSKTENHPIFMNADGKQAGLPNDKSVISASFNSDIAIPTPGRAKLSSNTEFGNALQKVVGTSNVHDTNLQGSVKDLDGFQNPALPDHIQNNHIPTDSNIPEFEGKSKFLSSMHSVDAAQNQENDEGVHSSEQLNHPNDNPDAANDNSESPIRESNTDSIDSPDSQFSTQGDPDVDIHRAESENAVNKQKISDDTGAGESPLHNQEEYDDREMQKGNAREDEQMYEKQSRHHSSNLEPIFYDERHNEKPLSQGNDQPVDLVYNDKPIEKVVPTLTTEEDRTPESAPLGTGLTSQVDSSVITNDDERRRTESLKNMPLDGSVMDTIKRLQGDDSDIEIKKLYGGKEAKSDPYGAKAYKKPTAFASPNNNEVLPVIDNPNDSLLNTADPSTQFLSSDNQNMDETADILDPMKAQLRAHKIDQQAEMIKKLQKNPPPMDNTNALPIEENEDHPIPEQRLAHATRIRKPIALEKDVDVNNLPPQEALSILNGKKSFADIQSEKIKIPIEKPKLHIEPLDMNHDHTLAFSKLGRTGNRSNIVNDIEATKVTDLSEAKKTEEKKNLANDEKKISSIDEKKIIDDKKKTDDYTNNLFTKEVLTILGTVGQISKKPKVIEPVRKQNNTISTLRDFFSSKHFSSENPKKEKSDHPTNLMETEEKETKEAVHDLNIAISILEKKLSYIEAAKNSGDKKAIYIVKEALSNSNQNTSHVFHEPYAKRTLVRDDNSTDSDADYLKRQLKTLIDEKRHHSHHHKHPSNRSPTIRDNLTEARDMILDHEIKPISKSTQNSLDQEGKAL